MEASISLNLFQMHKYNVSKKQHSAALQKII